MWSAAVRAAQPAACLPGHWPERPAGRLAILACGKAAAPMAAAAAHHYRSGYSGLVIQPDEPAGQTVAIRGFRQLRASHPVPDERSVAAAEAALELASGLAPDDLLLVLLSGGGSSLMCLPAAGLALQEKQQLTRQLLSCGATIEEINCVRKQLSRIKGGSLARACPAPVVTLAISDVPGDDPGSIASGPTVPDATTPDDARAILALHGVRVTDPVHRALTGAAMGRAHEAHQQQDRLYHIVASGMAALRSAADWCRQHGVDAVVLGDDLQGEARELAREHARDALHRAASGRSVCLLSGGETTVTLDASPGRGGRNTEYALALAIGLGGRPGIWALAADTDGVDGSGGHSGALVEPDTLQRAGQAGLDAEDFLRNHDSASFFERLGGLLAEGPTGTNVNDFRAILVNP
jgi:hydroxypyruvate reductase